ncbi:MAG: metallophosphoesterase family protein, partial [Promethearchaeota archaeon]
IGMLLERSIPKYITKDMKKQGISPAFTICTGDTVSNALDEPLWKSWFDDITSRTGLASNYPMQIAIGNHERHENCTGEIFADRYPYDSKPEFYYAFNYSTTHFLMLDPWNETSCEWSGLDPVQLAWTEQNLINSSSMKFKVISLHPPPLMGEYVFEELQPLIDLCDTYDVDAVFFGHWHRFGHWNINGTEYILNGVGGNNAPAANPSGFCQVDVSPTQMEISMHWLNGTNQPIVTILP